MSNLFNNIIKNLGLNLLKGGMSGTHQGFISVDLAAGPANLVKGLADIC